jgi:N-acetylneuraminic acid mutarotase
MRWPVALPVALLAAVLVLLPLAAIWELPGETAVQELFGQEYEEPCGPTIHAGDGGAWREEPAAPVTRDGPSGVRAGRYAYVVGGIESFDDEFEFVDGAEQLERFDLVARKWSSLPSMPAELNHVQLAAARGDLYVLGGLTAHLAEYTATGRSWRFDMESKRWEKLPPLPTPRGAGAAVTIGTRIYVVGGVAGSEQKADLEAYDLETGRWERLASMSSPRNHLGAATLGGQLYVLGGRGGNELSLDDFERYDPESDSWERLPGPPEPTAGFGFEAVNGRLVAAGGENLRHRVLTGRTWAFDPQTREWEALPSMDTPMHGQAMVAFRDRVYVFAGSRCSGYHPFRSAASLEVPPA